MGHIKVFVQDLGLKQGLNETPCIIVLYCAVQPCSIFSIVISGFCAAGALPLDTISQRWQRLFETFGIK